MSTQDTYETLEKKIKPYIPKEELTLIKNAYDFANTAHQGQYRKSGDPYITHPLAVATILAELEADAPTVAAALLHDTLEDCDVDEKQIKKHFGSDILQLVEGVTKLGKIKFTNKQEEQAENFRKMFLAMAKDIRVVIIKLADRLHNMRTLKHHSPSTRLRIARETREIFAPLAHRLGMWSVKWELEDLCFFHLDNKEFLKIKKHIAQKREEREHYVTKLVKEVEKQLKKDNINANVQGRPKHFFSIFKKMRKNDLSLEEIYDTVGVRILVDCIKECYETLGTIHASYKPMEGRFKDYIAMPKSNMYQSLHTTVIGPQGHPVEFQIRTVEMHDIAESGVAAHWRYKESLADKKPETDFAWLRQILELQKEKSAPEDFLQNLKLDLFIDEVFVFTPKGDVHVLQKGSTPLDFAYKVHTEVGHRFKGAKVNHSIVNITYQLRNGDQVEILTQTKQHPKIDWLHIVQSRHAKNKIKQWFRKENRLENIAEGKDKLQKTFIVLGYESKEYLTKDILQKLPQKYSANSMDDLYIMVALGDASTRDIISTIEALLNKPKPQALPTIPPIAKVKKQRKPSKTSSIIVLGEDNIETHMAQCCSPLPGDNIIGFIRMGYSISIHRADCPNILRIDDEKKARLIQVEWNTQDENTYPVLIEVEAFDRVGIMQEILGHIADTGINITALKTQTAQSGSTMKALITIEVTQVSDISRVRQSLDHIQDVYKIKRLRHK